MKADRTDIFFVDDDDLFREELMHVFDREGYRAEAFDSLTSCRQTLKDHAPLVILLDIQLPDGNGVEFLREVVSREDHPEVVMVSGAASLQEAADSVKHGAADFLEKPFEPHRLLSVLKSCLRIATLKNANRRLIESHLAEYEIIGESPVVQRLEEQIKQIADTDARVLIMGESGTGKELVAGQIHYRSGRSQGAYVKVNCSALPSELVESELFGHEKGAFTGALRSREGKFSLANGGTLLLDEIGDMPLELQPKLLRAIETSEIEPVGGSSVTNVDVRLISSTNHDIEKLASEGKFRSDLLYRINAVPIKIHPLREHSDDIPLLLDHFLDMLHVKNPHVQKQFDSEAVSSMVAYGWPGNVRELKNVVERLFFTTPEDLITREDVSLCIGEGADDSSVIESAASGGNRLSSAVNHFERSFLKTELKKSDGNITQLAEQLQMDRGNLYRKLKWLGLLSE
ncbi:MAG: sigma-54 dependent transcriptional regulator [candidate division Zixibacteria bacterium]|nr:sigma-54 dependent transcriptional regulator [candidate division Zixibacteria bacterium]MBU2623974.1 sigma-54 dependent transcriptional regulator [candidate division Zixibacteria bacterium]